MWKDCSCAFEWQDVLKLVADMKGKVREPPLPMEKVEAKVSNWTNTNTNKDWMQAEQQRWEDAKATTSVANRRNAQAAARKTMQEETPGETQEREEEVQELRTINGKKISYLFRSGI